MSIDRLSNMVSSIQNAAMTGKPHIEMPHAKILEEVAKVLQKKGFLDEVKVFKREKSKVKMLALDLKNGVITKARRVSKPGRRVYQNSQELKSSRGAFGTIIVSTPKGVMDGLEAKKKKLGGEVICEVY